MYISENPKLPQHPVFDAVSKAAQELGIHAYVVGGFVRDLILNRNAKKDIDIVCVGDGLALAETTANILKPGMKVSVFKNYGTANFRYIDTDVEFVGARKESYRSDSRNPIIEQGSLEDDQKRRDFTINALAISLNPDDYGKCIDPFNGIEDLQAGLIKTPLNPDTTFSDDPLGMMRAIRFASQLQFSIDQTSFESIQKNKDRIKIISQERITDELNKIILSPYPSIGFRLLFESGLLEIIFPEMFALHGVDTQNNLSHKDNFFHTIKVLDNLSQNTDNLWLRWSAVLHDIAKPNTKRFDPEHGWTFHGHEALGADMVPGIFRRMKLPLDQPMKYVQKLVRLHLRPISLSKENISDSAIRRLIFEAGDDIDDLLSLCRADITSKNKIKVKKFLDNFTMVEQKVREIEEKDHIRNFQPPIDGETIMQTFNIPAGPYIGIIKNVIKEAILEGEIHNDYQEAYDLMIKTGLANGLTPKA